MGASSTKEWSANDLPDLDGKVAIVTGANSGIGFEVARGLCQRRAHVILAGRSQEKLDAALHHILATVPEASVEAMVVDLARLTTVRRFSEEIREKHPAVQILVDNAGVAHSRPGKTEQGFDIVLGTNHFGTVALTQQLLPSLQAGAPSRVVVLTAAAEALAPPIAWDDIGGCDTENKGMPEVCSSKLYNALYARWLQEQVGAKGACWGRAHQPDELGSECGTINTTGSVSVFAVHPGMVRTDIYNKPETAPGLIVRIIAFLTMLFGAPPEKGALPVLFCAAAPELEGEAGKPVIYGPNNWMREWTGERPVVNPAYSAETAERLLKETLRLLKQKGFEVPAGLPR